jgi:hypothetical protein
MLFGLEIILCMEGADLSWQMLAVFLVNRCRRRSTWVESIFKFEVFRLDHDNNDAYK